ncbi:MAG: gamma carbonic anhydrase family protein [Ruminococcaceae bacterium]|nr:gamma carbonic anhydrase family protein [Oscillospiraceae bacterium]
MKKLFIAQGAVVCGNVTMGDKVSIWYNAVVRGDMAPITIGDESNVQECSVLHVSENMPLVLGKGVTVGHGAILHSCSVGDNSLIGMGAIVLDGAKIGKNCIIGAGALVTGGTEIPDGSLVIGSPGKVRREMTEAEIAANRQNAEEYVFLMEKELEY